MDEAEADDDKDADADKANKAEADNNEETDEEGRTRRNQHTVEADKEEEEANEERADEAEADEGGRVDEVTAAVGVKNEDCRGKDGHGHSTWCGLMWPAFNCSRWQ